MMTTTIPKNKITHLPFGDADALCIPFFVAVRQNVLQYFWETQIRTNDRNLAPDFLTNRAGNCIIFGFAN